MDAIKRFWGNLRLAVKLTLFVSLLVLLIISLVTIVTIRQAQADFRNGLENEARLLMETLPLTMRDALYRLEIDELRDTAEIVSSNAEITDFIIYNANGVILIDAADEGASFSQIVDPLGKEVVTEDSGEIILVWNNGNELIAGRAIVLGNQVIGGITLGLSTEALQLQVQAIARQNIFFAFLVLGVGAGLAYLFTLEITNPLSSLHHVALQMAEGDLSARVSMEYEDEVGQLGKVFNHMADAIKQRESELREFATGLEQAVQVRTIELSKTNENLLDEVVRRKASEAALVLARNEAVEASQLKTQLLANVSHDLRTPLNIILGYGEILQSHEFGELEEKSHSMVGEIINSAGLLLGFVNNLLDQAQIESGRIEFNYQPFNPQTLLENSFAVINVLADAKHIQLTNEINENMPDLIVGDYHWIYQGLYNLMTNAIKFTNEGTVHVEMSLVDETHWSISVADTGIGIPTEAREQIFDPFWQVDGTPTRGRMGSGLGLSIVKQLVDLMKGEIDLKSEQGKGTTFTMILPLHPIKTQEV